MNSSPTSIPNRAVTEPAAGSRFAEVRRLTERLRDPLSIEDCVIQSMPDVSPTKWHLAHTTWFFENFVCKRVIPGYQVFHPGYDFLFNSYYNSEGPQFPRPQRGLLSRPTVKEVEEYRAHVDARMIGYLESTGQAAPPGVAAVIELGLNHEQQHQELMLTDIKHVLSLNPLRPAYRAREADAEAPTFPGGWALYPEGIFSIGASDRERFVFDNERPRHREIILPFALATHPVTNGEYIEFIRDGGYRNPLLWLSAGWSTVREKGWEAPLYWERRDGEWWTMTLAGMLPVNPAEPVCHVSYFEADAYARWAASRLPTEAEWERAACDTSRPARDGNFVEDERFHPAPLAGESSAGSLEAMLGSVWEWTQSPYTPYPGFVPVEGALGEYNGKFMCNQYVLRGGSCATSRSHIRPTYRNFFPPEARWQFSGIRLARDI